MPGFQHTSQLGEYIICPFTGLAVVDCTRVLTPVWFGQTTSPVKVMGVQSVCIWAGRTWHSAGASSCAPAEAGVARGSIAMPARAATVAARRVRAPSGGRVRVLRLGGATGMEVPAFLLCFPVCFRLRSRAGRSLMLATGPDIRLT
ncbi:hypothetical protein GCM10010218_41710 [Streptomyces mashuensis]|uniref:Uncharacterized protein n=1 Tax=Streptomyces mashuensis TaxID=33904 RepID=A0A919B6P4_9ACTN|nr:hypothetical protein GCM10010218_41710 [Streptomyces mashuensis]